MTVCDVAASPRRLLLAQQLGRDRPVVAAPRTMSITFSKVRAPGRSAPNFNSQTASATRRCSISPSTAIGLVGMSSLSKPRTFPQCKMSLLALTDRSASRYGGRNRRVSGLGPR
jgi:hypothetical protein